MITSARIRDDLRDIDGLDWISALRSEGIRKLVDSKLIQRSLFDECELAEIVSEGFPGERLIVCNNPILADERARKREELLPATEQKLEPIRRATQRKTNPLCDKQNIGLRVGKVIGLFKMEKHFELTITDDSLTYTRRGEKISAEATRSSAVAPSKRSDTAKRKDATRRTAWGHSVQGFQDLLKDMTTITRNRIRIAEYGAEYDKLTTPTDYQRHVLGLLEAKL